MCIRYFPLGLGPGMKKQICELRGVVVFPLLGIKKERTS
jgi:hypothetical protein